METGDITLVGIGVAVIAVLIALYFGLRQEMREQSARFRAEMREQRAEMREESAQFRAEMRGQNQRISAAEREQALIEGANSVLVQQSHTHDDPKP